MRETPKNPIPDWSSAPKVLRNITRRMEGVDWTAETMLRAASWPLEKMSWVKSSGWRKKRVWGVVGVGGWKAVRREGRE